MDYDIEISCEPGLEWMRGWLARHAPDSPRYHLAGLSPDLRGVGLRADLEFIPVGPGQVKAVLHIRASETPWLLTEPGHYVVGHLRYERR